MSLTYVTIYGILSTLVVNDGISDVNSSSCKFYAAVSTSLLSYHSTFACDMHIVDAYDNAIRTKFLINRQKTLHEERSSVNVVGMREWHIASILCIVTSIRPRRNCCSG